MKQSISSDGNSTTISSGGHASFALLGKQVTGENTKATINWWQKNQLLWARAQ